MCWYMVQQTSHTHFEQATVWFREMCWVWIVRVAILARLAHHSLAASRQLSPCDLQIVKFNVSLHYSDTLVVLANSSRCGSPFQPYSGFKVYSRLELENNATLDMVTEPVVFAARRADKGGITSWNVPLDLEINGTSVPQRFESVSHTMCPVQLNNSAAVSPPLPLFYIDVFTYSSKPLFYTVYVEPVSNYVLSIINTSSSQFITISPAAPQVFYFKFPSNYETVTIEVRNVSEAVGCAYISVQNNTCPFNDLLDDTKGKGMYQSMTEKAMLTVETEWIQNREFLLVLAAANYSVCHDMPLSSERKAHLSEFLAHGQQVEIKIKEMNNINKYILAILFPILLSVGIAICSSVAVCCCFTVLCEPCCVPIVCKKEQRSCRLCYHFGPCKFIFALRPLLEKINTSDESSIFQLTCYKKENTDGELGIPCGDGDDTSIVEGTSNEKQSLITRKSTAHGTIQTQEGAGVRNQIVHNRKRHLEYAWGAVIVGIFYALPTTQLLIFHQQILHWSGDEDACYYNFMCTRPAFQLSAFNNICSNACYVLLGLWFCAIVFSRHIYFYRKYKYSDEEERHYTMSHGIHQHFGVYYAMGIGLAFEGLMGCCYHICPNNSNFQFDTAFMYIICGLAIVKLIHIRNSTVSTNAFAVFISLGVVILFTVIGIYKDRHNPFAVKLSFGLLMLLFALPVVVVSFFALKIYKANVKLTAYTTIKDNICCKWYTVRLAIIILLNIIVCVVLLTNYNGIASTIFDLLFMNALLLLLLYSVTKILHGEPLTFLAMFLPVVIAVSTIFALYFYAHRPVTMWEEPPAESRTRNDECILMDFYDSHDVWHMSIACALFFLFLFILIIDDGVLHKERKMLRTF